MCVCVLILQGCKLVVGWGDVEEQVEIVAEALLCPESTQRADAVGCALAGHHDGCAGHNACGRSCGRDERMDDAALDAMPNDEVVMPDVVELERV